MKKPRYTDQQIAQAKLPEWQRDYNKVRPHSSLGHIPPREFAAAW